MNDDNNLYLCTSVHSDSGCKFTIEYTSEDDGFKEIPIDTYEEIKLSQNDAKYYKISGEMEFIAKITRNSGFPFIRFT